MNLAKALDFFSKIGYNVTITACEISNYLVINSDNKMIIRGETDRIIIIELRISKGEKVFYRKLGFEVMQTDKNGSKTKKMLY